jgi:hypothetical protein
MRIAAEAEKTLVELAVVARKGFSYPQMPAIRSALGWRNRRGHTAITDHLAILLCTPGVIKA